MAATAPTTVKAFAAQNATDPLAATTISRRVPNADDVSIDIAYCGVCHSDLHTAKGEWANTAYPCVPGHEIVGRVTAVGSAVTKFKVGDLAGVGCMVDSCGACASCSAGEQQYCDAGKTCFTYNSKDSTGANTLGGYSASIVVKESFVVRITHDVSQLAGVAPLLCAGITLYSPLHHWGAGPGKKVGIVGLGGLGHMGVKIGAAMGATVVLFTTSERKREDALRMGAAEVIISTDAAAVAATAGTFDLIVDTLSVPHSLDPYVAALKRDGQLVLVGAPDTPHPTPNIMQLVFRRRSIAGSLIGGVPETQEMLDFCAAKGIVSDIELIRAEQINDAYKRMVKADVKYRFVIDSTTL